MCSLLRLSGQTYARAASIGAIVLVALTVLSCSRVERLRLGLSITTLASGLDIPWALAFVPDGRLFFTQRDSGQIRVLTGGALQPAPVITLPVCCASGEGGAMGLVPDPGFAANGFLYVYYTHLEFGAPFNRIERLRVAGNTAVRDRVLLDRIPGSRDRHNGGRLAIGPDGMLYASNGDSSDQSLPQNPGSLAGKILRMTLGGQIPPDNPLPGSLVYTLGHRNVQGLAWDASGTLYATEHGPRSNDEVNQILPGRNYGWPVIVGRGEDPDHVDPIFLFLPETCAPSGATFVTGPMFPDWRGDLLFTCLRGAHLHRLRLAGPGSTVVEQSQVLLANAYGRLRDIIVGPDGALYVSTSSGDGGDQILRIAR